MLNTLPEELTKDILILVDEMDSLEQVSKVSRYFCRISHEIISENLSKTLRHYKRHGSHYDEAMIAATLLSKGKKLEKLHQFLRVSLNAFYNNRMIESFIQWRDYTEGEPVFFFSEINAMRRNRKPYLTEDNYLVMRSLFYARSRDYIDTMKKEGSFKPVVVVDCIVMYAYHAAIERAFKMLSLAD